jgi:translocation and assembly module TamA
MRRLLAVVLLLLPLALSAAQPRIKVEIEGVEDAALENIRSYLSILIYRDSAELSEASVRRLHARAGEEIRQALQPFGRYAPEVEASLVANADGWLARYRVTPGPEVLWAGVELAIEGPGQTDPAFADAAARLPITVGAPLRHAQYEAAKLSLQQRAEDHGYLDARFTESVLEVEPERLAARARLRFTTGRQFRFGPLTFEQDFLDPALVARYATFTPGEVFSVSRLLEMQYALNDSDYFASVRIEPQREAVDPEGRIPVLVVLSPRPRLKYTLGFGFGTDTGPRITLGAENRRLNAAGHRVSTELQWSPEIQQLEARWLLPLARPADERLQLQSRIIREEPGDTVSRKLELGAALTKRLGRWQQTAYTRYNAERSVVPGLPETSSELIVPGVTWTRIERDDPVYPRRGYRLTADLHGSHDDLGSDATFLQWRLGAKRVQPLGESGRLILRGDLAGTRVGRLSALPVSERLFAGGDQSVRGFRYQDIGSTDALGNVIGGEALVTASIELERHFGGKWGGAVFMDAGDAPEALDTVSLRKGVGYGLRWRSPVGMVRLDLARPIGEAREAWRLHISIGPDL